MKLLTLILIILLLPTYSLAQNQYGPHLNTVPFFGSTAKANEKHGYTHYKNHNSYSSWIQPGSITPSNPTGSSCCNGANEAADGLGDCDITRIYREEGTELPYIMYDDKKLYLPPERRVREADNVTFKKSPDGNGHACISEFWKGKPVVLCWVDGDVLN
jgi:hypothetical protein